MRGAGNDTFVGLVLADSVSPEHVHDEAGSAERRRVPEACRAHQHPGEGDFILNFDHLFFCILRFAAKLMGGVKIVSQLACCR